MNITDYMSTHKDEAFNLLIELAQIPAPSGHEERRAAFCKQWLELQGADVFIDKALNVVYPIGCEGDREIVVFMAHSDVVFPDMDKLPLTIRHGRIYCPGVGDDTANAVALLMTAKYIAEHRLAPKNKGVLLVINSCEEGLGNLKGCRQIMADFGQRITEFVTFDDRSEHGVYRAVGSRRFRVEAHTEGGHSFNHFGRPNAIAALAALVHRLYQVQVPTLGKTTYNVGVINGGTSVNTIAQQAEMLYEFRSDVAAALEEMQAEFDRALEECRAEGVTFTVVQVGDRPCSGAVDEEKLQLLMNRGAAAVQRYYGHGVEFGAGSTDCNIPLSMGVPAICVGCRDGVGAHTREEYVEIDSLYPGLCVAAELVLYYF